MPSLPRGCRACFSGRFPVKFDRLPEEDGGHGKLVFQITDPEKLDRIINQLGYDPRQTMVLHVNFALLEDECCRTAFLRGAFLAGGSVTDPEKRYHLELTGSHAQASREMSALLTEMGFLPRSVRRGGATVIYFKQSEHIEDLLTTIGAPASAMDVMTAKVDKSIRNGANRAMNCDMANVNKTLDAAEEQLTAIERLRGRERVGESAGKAPADGAAAPCLPGAVACAACGALRSAGDKIMHEPQNEKTAGESEGTEMTKEERCRAAKAYREKGLNCAQCLLATFRDVAGLTEQQALGLGAGLGGGVRCGGICGAVSAPVLILGASCPDPSDRPHTTKLTKEFESRFAERFHRLDCRELLPAQDLEPSELAQELAAGDHCGLLIVTAAGILSDMLGETA